MFKQLYLALKKNPIKYYHSGVRVDQGGMAMKEFTISPITPEQEPHNLIVLCNILETNLLKFSEYVPVFCIL